MRRIALLAFVGAALAATGSSRADDPAANGARALAEKMTVKVYAVPDLVAAAEAAHAEPSSLHANSEMAEALQAIQIQAQLIQASVQAAQATAAAEPSNEVVKKLERLMKALRVAAPKDSWAESGGEGEIEIYPDALCLIVRQTSAGHEAIADLLSQLRAAQSVQIELTVELTSFEGIAEETAAEAMQFLNRELSAEELGRFRQSTAKTAMAGVVRVGNGRSADAWIIPGMPMAFSAVASANRNTVEFRADLKVPVDLNDGFDKVMRQAFSQSRTVTAGKTFAYLISEDGRQGTIVVVTAKVVDCSPVASK